MAFDFNTLSERPISKLSENLVIRPMKLWPFKDALFNFRYIDHFNLS